jgi:hypothetical protein
MFGSARHEPLHPRRPRACRAGRNAHQRGGSGHARFGKRSRSRCRRCRSLDVAEQALRGSRSRPRVRGRVHGGRLAGVSPGSSGADATTTSFALVGLRVTLLSVGGAVSRNSVAELAVAPLPRRYKVVDRGVTPGTKPEAEVTVVFGGTSNVTSMVWLKLKSKELPSDPEATPASRISDQSKPAVVIGQEAVTVCGKVTKGVAFSDGRDVGRDKPEPGGPVSPALSEHPPARARAARRGPPRPPATHSSPRSPPIGPRRSQSGDRPRPPCGLPWPRP